MTFVKHFRHTSIMAAVALALSACGGGGGGGGGGDDGGGSSSTVTGLEMPAKLSVVAAQDTSASKASGTNPLAGVISSNVSPNNTLAADSDFNSDESQTWVYDPSMEGLSMVNEILCYMDQLGAKEMVNQGAYVAMVNEDKCIEGENESGASSGGAQASSSSASQQTSYARWVVKSDRADSTSPQIVKIWVPGDQGGMDPMDNQSIMVETTITEGVSDTKPFGTFVMNFKGVVPSGTTMPDGNQTTSDTTVMNGTLKTVDNDLGKPQFSFYNVAGAAMGGGASMMPFSRTEASNVQMDDASGSSGTALTLFEESFDENGDSTPDWTKSARFAVAFNDNLFLRGKGADYADTVCTDRNNFNTQTWRYNLYTEATGSRVTLNSGFPITYSDIYGTHYGHVGYWGVWLDGSDSVSPNDLDNLTVTKEVYGADFAPSYTVNVSGGKLWKRTRNAAIFEDLVGVDMNWWGDPSDPFCMATTPCPNQMDYRVTVVDNGDTTYSVQAIATIQWGDYGPITADITPVTLTLTNESDQLWMWSDSLGGSVVVKNDGVVFYKEEIVALDTANLHGLELVCYENCPKGGVTITDTTTEADLFWIQWGNDGSQSHTYTVQVANGKINLLDEANNPVTFFGDLSAISDGYGGTVDWYQWGIQTGEMVTTTDNASLTNWYDIYNTVDVTYRWETGPNDWNRQLSLVNIGTNALVTFDKPLQLDYSYAAGDDPNHNLATHPSGNKFMLEYGGPGQLWGFPWEPEPNCDPSVDDCRFITSLNLKPGVVLTSGTSDYIVKPMESEQTMLASADPDACAAAGLDVSSVGLILPSGVDGSVSITLADKPTVVDAPAVIEGELQ